MNGKNINFDDKKIKKSKFYKNKKVFQVDDIDIIKILVSKKEPYGTKNALKYFIGYNDNDVIRLLCLRLPQMTGYAKKINENTTISFRVNNKNLFKNYNKIWEKVKNYQGLILKANLFMVMMLNTQNQKQKNICRQYDYIIKKCQKKKHHASVYQ